MAGCPRKVPMITQNEIERCKTLLALSEVVLAETNSLLDECQRIFPLRLIRRNKLLKQANKLLDEHRALMDEIEEIQEGARRRSWTGR
jgi:ribosomal protein S3AE